VAEEHLRFQRLPFHQISCLILNRVHDPKSMDTSCFEFVMSRSFNRCWNCLQEIARQQFHDPVVRMIGDAPQPK